MSRQGRRPLRAAVAARLGTRSPSARSRRPDEALPVWVLALCVALLLLHAVMVVLLVRPAADPQLHRAPVSIVAPSVVGEVLVSRAEDLAGAPLDAVVAEDLGSASRDVAEGAVVAALVMDLADTEDELILNGGRDPLLNQAVREQVEEVLRANGRTLRVSSTAAPRDGRPEASRVAVVASVVGLLLAMAVSLLFGPVPPRLGAGVRRIAVLGALSLVLGTAGAFLSFDTVGADRALVLLVLAAAIMLPAALTLAIGALVGLSGLALGASLFVALATPLLVGIDRHLLPPAWRLVDTWSPAGATREALEDVTLFGGAGVGEPLLVLLAWFALAILVMLAARRERDRSAVRLHGPDRGSPSTGARWWRLRVAVVVLPSAALLVTLLALVSPGRLPSVAPLADSATQTRCVATGEVRSVRDLNRISREIRGTGAFRGGDVGASALLQDGRRMLVFGDTLRQLPGGGQTFVRNSMLLLAPGCIQAVLPADGGALIPDRPGGGGVGYWPMSVNVSPRPGYDLVGVTAQRVRTTGDGPFDFENLGGSVAVFIVAPERSPQLLSVTDLGPDSADVTRPTWGAGSVVHEGWAYVYGTAASTEELTFGHSLHLARVRPDRVQELGAWRYWDGEGWSRSADDAVALVDPQGGTSQTLSVFERDGTWYALSKRDDFLGSEVAVWTAPAPWGPFDAGRAVAALPSDVDAGQLRYMPLAHPDLLPEPDSVVVSYSRNRTSLGEVLADPLQYRPRFLRVPLP